MTDTTSMSDDEFQTHVLQIVSRELGLGAAARFIRLNLSGRGDYTRDRHQWLDGLTLEQIAEDMQALDKRTEHSLV